MKQLIQFTNYPEYCMLASEYVGDHILIALRVVCGSLEIWPQCLPFLTFALGYLGDGRAWEVAA